MLMHFPRSALPRREALWAAKALGRVGDRDDDLPLFTTGPGDAHGAYALSASPT